MFGTTTSELELWMDSHNDPKWVYKPYKTPKLTLNRPTKGDLAGLFIDHNFCHSKDLRTINKDGSMSLGEWLDAKAGQFPYKPKKIATLGKPPKLSPKASSQESYAVALWNGFSPVERAQKLARAKAEIRSEYRWV
jgi:hypothetical protein